MHKHPNFLVFVTDQQRADHVGYSGNTKVRTPNLDAIADQGSWWSRFYTASPTCMSNRASLMTGRMPSLHGVRYNGVPLDLESVTFVDLLRSAGYRTALIGKSHLQGLSDEPALVPRQAPEKSFALPPDDLSEARRSRHSTGEYQEERIRHWREGQKRSDTVRLPYYGFDTVAFCLGHGDSMTGHYSEWLESKGYDLKAGLANALETGATDAPQLYKPHTPPEFYPTTFVAERTCDILDDCVQTDAPFFIQCSFPDPHHPFTPPGEYWDMFDADDMELPASFVRPGPDAIAPLKSLWEEFERGDTPARFSYPFVTDPTTAREILAKTFGQIAMIDDAIGTVMAKLAELQLAKNTVVIFLSDHGDYLGDHGMMLKGPLHYPSVVRTPFVWMDPDSRFRCGQIDDLASTIDIATTVLHRAGIQPFNGIQGRDLLQQVAKVSLPRQGVLIEQTTQYPCAGFEDVVAVHTIIEKNWRLSVWQNCDWGELYNLEDDPDEMHNLWNDRSHQATKSDLLLRMVHAIQNHAETSPYPMTVS